MVIKHELRIDTRDGRDAGIIEFEMRTPDVATHDAIVHAGEAEVRAAVFAAFAHVVAEIRRLQAALVEVTVEANRTRVQGTMNELADAVRKALPPRRPAVALPPPRATPAPSMSDLDEIFTNNTFAPSGSGPDGGAR